MENNNTKLLLNMAKEKKVLRVTSTGIDGQYNTTPELAHQILTTYGKRIDEADFPVDKRYFLR